MFLPVRSRAAFGQVVGLVMRAAVAQYPTLQPNLHSYAIIGAAGMLGGVTRMTVSCTVLVMETTGSLQVRAPSSPSTHTRTRGSIGRSSVKTQAV